MKVPLTILFLMVLGFSFKRVDSSEIVRYSLVIGFYAVFAHHQQTITSSPKMVLASLMGRLQFQQGMPH